MSSDKKKQTTSTVTTTTTQTNHVAHPTESKPEPKQGEHETQSTTLIAQMTAVPPGEPHGAPPRGAKTVMVAIDPHPYPSHFHKVPIEQDISDCEFEAAANMIDPTQDKLVIVAAINIEKVMFAYSAGFAYGVRVDKELKEYEENLCRRALTKFGKLCREKGIQRYELVLRRGDPRIAIVEAAASREADLVVVGHRGTNVFQRILNANVSKYVVHHSSANVLVVK